MKFRVVLLFNLCVVAGFGQYVWDYTKNPVASDTTRWSSNGSSTYGSYGVNFSGSGGSLISIPGISVENPTTAQLTSSNSSDYEVASFLALNSGGGTYIHFLRTSGGTVESGSGSYISVELVIPSGFSTIGLATLNINQCVNGTVTQLGSTSIWAVNGMLLRTVVFGGNLWVLNATTPVWSGTIPVTTGNPGIGGYGMPNGSGFQGIALGHHDVIAAGAVIGTSISSSVFPTSVSLQWQGVVDDPTGIGLMAYYIVRDGVLIEAISHPEFTDATVQPGTTYNYSIFSVDFHGNSSARAAMNVTTPPANAIDPHRTGIYTTGSYWGGGGEQMDTLSGNLNFSVPLVKAQGRTGWTVPVALVYNSQNWRQDNGVNWKLGDDVGYGFGWQMLIGSLTPYYTSYWTGVDHYVYTDSTGAQYRLDQNSNGVWSGANVYVWFDSNANRLHFKNGSFWVMGSTSGGTEADAGTMYPTIIEDTFGNQVIVTYAPGAGLPANGSNSSARITIIEDSRAATGFNLYSGPPYKTYTFGYNSDVPVPHLTTISNSIQTGEAYSMTYAEGAALGPPFGADPSYSGLTTTHLATITTLAANPWQFTYDSAGAGELLQATFPWGGHLRWTYGSDPYSGGRALRTVSGRYLATDTAGATEWSYGISRDNASGAIVHGTMTLSDASGVGTKTWNFFNTSSYPAWQIGLAKEFVQNASAGGTVLQDDVYTWSQSPSGNPYISMKSSTIGQGTPNVETATSTQILDQYGNVTQSAIYPYNNVTTPLRTYTSTYLNSSNYTSNYVFNLLSSTTLSTGGAPFRVVGNQYDASQYSPLCDFAPDGAVVCGYSNYTPQGVFAPTHEFDSSSPVPVTAKGAMVTGIANGRGAGTVYYPWGTVYTVRNDDGTISTASADPGTNYAAPQTITTQGYSETIGYTAWLGVAQTTGPNGEQMSVSYDALGRPSTATSPYSTTPLTPTATWVYSTSLPWTATETGPDGVTVTMLDGLGRGVVVSRGDTSGAKSFTQTVYAPCACSPLGKIQQVSQPYAGGSSPSAWTTYTYDGLGRTLSVVQPDGASTTTYAYAGNQTTVTDPAGKWKQFTDDALGNLTTVVEPDPANAPSGTLTTSYTYDWMNHVAQVSMPRGGTTQTRTFVYDGAGRLISATNPENGTVTYSYNANGKLYDKHDAKGQDTLYTYDSNNRVTMVQQYPNGLNWAEDTCARVTYTYDTNPVNPAFSQYSAGRLTTMQYYATNSSGPAGCWPDLYTEMYSYHPAGGVTAKQLQLQRAFLDQNQMPQTGTGSLEVDYTYDGVGRTATTSYPGIYDALAGGPPVYTYSYDTMGRPATLKSNFAGNALAGAQYDYAGRLASLYYWSGGATVGEGRTYNVNGQLATLSWNTGVTQGGVTYTYSATANNGQITQMTDTLSGEVVTYQYDALKRLTAASSSPINGSSPAAWTQTYQYDGFGNLTQSILNGTATTIAVDPATNRLTYGYYDANGNENASYYGYDESNRMIRSWGSEYIGYDPANKRVYMSRYAFEAWTLYGAKGEKLGVFYGATPVYVCNGSVCGYQLNFTAMGTNLWFAGRMVQDSGANPGAISGGIEILQDRLGTNRASGARYYPYGGEITSTGDDRVKFGTYTRDSVAGLDYADQRYYSSVLGRFNTADPYIASGGASDPVSWNRYSYTRGDPVNRVDARGTDDCPVDTCMNVTDTADPLDGISSDPYSAYQNCASVAEYAATGVNPVAQVFVSLYCSNVNFGGAVQAASIPPNKGGYFTNPSSAARTAWQYLNNNWMNCLSDFEQSQKFNVAAFQSLLSGGINWVSDINGMLNNATVGSVANNGSNATIGSLFTGSASAVTIRGTNTVILGPDYFTNETQTQQIAVMIHEALHIELGLNDIGLAGWLGQFGFTPAAPFNSGQITDWIVGTKNLMDTDGGCPHP